MDFEAAKDANSLACTTTDCSGKNDPKTRVVEEDVKPSSTSKIDILFVVDNSGSMEIERNALGMRLSAFIGGLSRFDWHICVVATDVINFNGELLPFKNGSRVLDSGTPDANNLFLDRIANIPTENGAGDEQGINAMSIAFSNPDSRCFRQDAALAAIVLSDEDERSTGGYPEYSDDKQFRPLGQANLPENLVQTVRSTMGASKIFTAHSIVIRSGDQACYDSEDKDSPVWFGTRYEQLSKMTGGIIGNICATDYAAQLQDFAARIGSSTTSVTLQCVPANEPEITFNPSSAAVGTTRVGDKILFASPLPSNATVHLMYRCQI